MPNTAESQATITAEIQRLAEFVAKDLIEQAHKAYPELDIDTCNPQVWSVIHRCMTSGVGFQQRVLDHAAAVLDMPGG